MTLQELKNRIVLLLNDKSDKTPEQFIEEVDSASDAAVLNLLRNLDETAQKELHAREDKQIDAILSCHQNLSLELVDTLMASYGDNIARYHIMDMALFERLIDSYPLAMASNESIDFAMQRRVYCYTDDVQQALASNPKIHQDMAFILFETNKPPIKIALAKNPATPVTLLEQMQRDKSFYKALAGNEKTPLELLKGLAQSEDVEVLLALASNSITPSDVLQTLALDDRLYERVKAHPNYQA